MDRYLKWICFVCLGIHPKMVLKMIPKMMQEEPKKIDKKMMKKKKREQPGRPV